MTKSEFLEWAEKAGIPKGAYSLDTENRSASYVLEDRRGFWTVFIEVDRGTRELPFGFEATALEYIRDQLLIDYALGSRHSEPHRR